MTLHLHFGSCCISVFLLSIFLSFLQSLSPLSLIVLSLLFLQVVSISEWGSEGMSTRKSWLTELCMGVDKTEQIYLGDGMSQQLSWQKWWNPELTDFYCTDTENSFFFLCVSCCCFLAFFSSSRVLVLCLLSFVSRSFNHFFSFIFIFFNILSMSVEQSRNAQPRKEQHKRDCQLLCCLFSFSFKFPSFLSSSAVLFWPLFLPSCSLCLPVSILFCLLLFFCEYSFSLLFRVVDLCVDEYMSLLFNFKNHRSSWELGLWGWLSRSCWYGRSSIMVHSLIEYFVVFQPALQQHRRDIPPVIFGMEGCCFFPLCNEKWKITEKISRTRRTREERQEENRAW